MSPAYTVTVKIRGKNYIQYIKISHLHKAQVIAKDLTASQII